MICIFLVEQCWDEEFLHTLSDEKDAPSRLSNRSSLFLLCLHDGYLAQSAHYQSESFPTYTTWNRGPRNGKYWLKFSIFIPWRVWFQKRLTPVATKCHQIIIKFVLKRMVHHSSSDDWDRLDFIYQKYFLHWNFTLYLKKKISMAGIEQRVIRGSEGNKIPLLS